MGKVVRLTTKAVIVRIGWIIEGTSADMLEGDEHAI